MMNFPSLPKFLFPWRSLKLSIRGFLLILPPQLATPDFLLSTFCEYVIVLLPFDTEGSTLLKCGKFLVFKSVYLCITFTIHYMFVGCLF